MVKQFGMSEKVGVRMFDNEAFDSGLSMLKVNDVSPATTDLVDSEIKRLLQVSPPVEFCSFWKDLPLVRFLVKREILPVLRVDPQWSFPLIPAAHCGRVTSFS